MRVKSCFTFLLAFLISGCFVHYWAYKYQGGVADAATGEEHVVNFPPNEAFQLTQSVLRGEGILFEIQPENRIVTFWRNADNPGTMLGSLVGIKPKYRYEIQVVPEGAKSKIIVNVRVEDIPDEQIDQYKASNKLGFFRKLDDLAVNLPPGPTTPSTGGVNYALLPNETLAHLAQRVTGSSGNWKAIAQDNGINSESDVSAFQTIWVRNDLIKSEKASRREPSEK
jgi:hypothetical protein